jgi:hypothetical protein
VRPDNLAVFFATAGVIAVESGGGRGGRWALPLFLAAGLAKQSAVAAPAAALLWLALRDRTAALRLALGLGAASALSIAALQLASDGWFWFHAWTSHTAKPFAWQRAWQVSRSFLELHAPLALFGAVFWTWLAARRRVSCAFLWLPLAVLATLGSGKSGSDTNYFLEPVAALALLAARELPLPLAPAAGRTARGLATAAALLVVLLAASNLRLHLANAAWIPEAEVRFAAVADTWGRAPGDAIADDAGFLLRTGRRLLFRPFIMTQLTAAGLWDERPLLEALESGEVALVVAQRRPAEIFRSRYSPAVRRVLARRYERVASYRTDFEYELLAPRRP